MEKIKTYFQNFVIRCLAQGPVPRHLAFIMDGNRRWAKNNKKSTKQGHEKGALTLRTVIEIAQAVGVKEMTVFALSIDNLKRDKEEVDYLMNLARKFFNKMSDNENLFNEKEIKVLIHGDLDKGPEDVAKEMRGVMERTKDYTKFTLNVCFLYSSKDEVLRSMEGTYEEMRRIMNGDIDLDEDETIEERLQKKIKQGLMVKSQPDILVRTGDDRRLSKFLCFQSTCTELMFLKEKWPDMGLLSMVKIFMYYKMKFEEIRKNKSDFLGLDD